jgi:hypothetical protein
MIEPTSAAPVSSSSAWIPLLSALGGYLVSAVTEYFRDRRASKREREARDAARHLQQLERRTNFQRQTLLELQEAVQQFGRTSGTAYFVMREDFQSTGKWGEVEFSDKLNSERLQATTKIIMVSVRVRDERVRELTAQLKKSGDAIFSARSKAEAQAAYGKMIASIGPFHDRVGEVLRKLDDDEEAAG